MRPERESRPATNGPAQVLSTATKNEIIVPLTGCPDGCLEGEPCITDRPAPTRSQFCRCSGLPIDAMVWAYRSRWHYRGHPEGWVA